MEELVSIVVPVYNAEQHLTKCIESITGQTYRHLQIILVDDGSTDGSLALSQALAAHDGRICVIHKENGGPGTARNAGIDAAEGKYLLFLDSDDYIHRTTVEKCVSLLEQAGSDVVIFGRSEVYPDGNVREKRIDASKPVYRDEEIRQELLPRMFTYELGFGVGVWGKMYDLQMIRDFHLRFIPKDEIIYEDVFFTLDLYSMVGSVSLLPECLYYYCRNDNSFSRVFRKDRQVQNDLFLKKSLEHIETHSLPQKLVYHVQSRYHGFTLGTLMQIMRSDLNRREKLKELNRIYRNETLHGTLDNQVLTLDAKFPRLFWRCLRMRCYWLCTMLLYVNMYK